MITHYRQLPRFGKTRWRGGKRKRHAGAKLIPGRIDITERPAIVEKRSRLGDWEGDTVHGQSAYLVTLVERKSLYWVACCTYCLSPAARKLLEII